MGTVKISPEGRNYIRKICSGNGNSLLSGSANDKRGTLLPYCSPPIPASKIWISNPDINGGITTNAELGEALIKWYDKYAEIYQMDANIMAAQSYRESGFIVWNYAGGESSASGISQYLSLTIYGIIGTNKYGGFTIAEQQAITKDVFNYTSTAKIPPKDLFSLGINDRGRKYRAIVHQNVTDNPEIMIKAQFEYMNYIGKLCNYVASSALFGYNRGPAYAKSSYSASIQSSKAGGKGYEDEGIKYVYKIFQNLYQNFGYSQLNITAEAAENFDKFNSALG